MTPLMAFAGVFAKGLLCGAVVVCAPLGAGAGAGAVPGAGAGAGVVVWVGPGAGAVFLDVFLDDFDDFAFPLDPPASLESVLSFLFSDIVVGHS